MNYQDTELSAFHPLPEEIMDAELPLRFTYPFCYEAHPLAKAAALDLQRFLDQDYDNEHNFGIDPDHEGLVIGKMFGVLVVRHQGTLGYLAAYSGKLAQGRQHPYFVPPVYDVFQEDGMFMHETKFVTALNTELEALEADDIFLELSQSHSSLKEQADAEIAELRRVYLAGKKDRKKRRVAAEASMTLEDLELFKEKIRMESLKQQYDIRMLTNSWTERLSETEQKLGAFLSRIEGLKEARREASSALQQRLFENYRFLNAQGEWKSLLTIFTEELSIAPPAGAGECAAPKLMQYAYMHGLEPVAMAEFWWGASPKSEIRKHGEFYPACRSKCGPILGFMLEGLQVDENPLGTNPAEGKELNILYEDDDVLVVDKPAEFLSVPGKLIKDSVQFRIQKIYPEATLVHRLDQSTSGIILIGKNYESYVNLQKQFLKRTVNKRYLALLEGIIEKDSGEIILPLRVDLDDRPRQVVCYEYGKYAKTCYEVLKRENGKTLIYFYPLTGRTHQLRVHAAHASGLNMPIVGDDLYGTKAERLYLHAQLLEFNHPKSGERISLCVDPDFGDWHP